MARISINKTDLNDLFFISRTSVKDSRGSLERLFCVEELKMALKDKQIKQINLTKTNELGTVRGIHFRHQPNDEIKIVTCLRGKILDVAVDLRPSSPTYLKWFQLELSPINQLAMVLPEGFGHGYQCLTDHCELLYFHTGIYHPESEDGIFCQDPVLGISWPLPVCSLSERDRSYKPLTEERIKSLR